MSYLLLILVTLLSGCAATQQHVYTPPSSLAVVKAVQGTKEKVAEVKQYVRPEGSVAVKELEQKVEETQTSLDSYVAQVDTLTSRAMQAENDAAYWKAKQIKALKELYFWRLIALSIAASITIWIGIRTSWKFIV
jgi:nitrate/nitrite-specific signal transduction histidine kinase